MKSLTIGDEIQTAADALVTLLESRIAASTRNSSAGKVTYIIGNNGTGKSRVLGALAQRLATTRPARTVACIASSIHDRFKYNDDKRVRYLGARNQTNAVFLAGIDRQLSRLILRAMTIERGRFRTLLNTVSMNIEFQLGEDFEAQIARLLKEPAEGAKRRRSKASAFKNLANARPMATLRRIAQRPGSFENLTNFQIETLLQYLELGIDIQLDAIFEDSTRLNFGELSTGEQNRILILAKVLSCMEQSAVFLIDEPEVSLHLHWQMKFHETLMDLLSGLTRFHVVIATHAPIIISEAAKNDPFNKKNLVAILRHDTGNTLSKSNKTGTVKNVTLDTHSFAEVASHDQLVLRYFQAAPYQTREISVEIADAVLQVAEGAKTPVDADRLLNNLKCTEGLSTEAINQINDALSLVYRDWSNFFKKGGSL